MKENCKKGEHNLIEILSAKHSWDESEQVVRWCSYCGCVSVDLDYDDRTQSGRIMTMKAPQILIDENL